MKRESKEERKRGGRRRWPISLRAFNSVEDEGKEVLISLNQLHDIESVI